MIIKRLLFPHEIIKIFQRNYHNVSTNHVCILYSILLRNKYYNCHGSIKNVDDTIPIQTYNNLNIYANSLLFSSRAGTVISVMSPNRSRSNSSNCANGSPPVSSFRLASFLRILLAETIPLWSPGCAPAVPRERPFWAYIIWAISMWSVTREYVSIRHMGGDGGKCALA